jgi:hypothetical protein
MKYPDHLILDIKPNLIKRHTPYWVGNYYAVLGANYNSYGNFLNYNTLSPTYSYLIEVLDFKKAKFSNPSQTLPNLNSLSLTWSLFNIVFLRKEKLYTKLKYSRCPQYDIVSGGIAGLFAGFLGFLIQEKFGLELLDSGDFYIVLMYSIFITFAFRPLLRSLSKDKPTYSILSIKFLYTFLISILGLVVALCNDFLVAQGAQCTKQAIRIGSYLKQSEYFSTTVTAIQYVFYWIKNWPKL